MQPDLSRCSSQSGEQANGGNGCSSVGVGGTPPGSAVMLEVGGGGMPQQQSHQQTIHNTNTSHAHSLSQLQPQQQLPKPTAAVEPIAIAKPHVKKVRVGNKEKDGRKNVSFTFYIFISYSLHTHLVNQMAWHPNWHNITKLIR